MKQNISLTSYHSAGAEHDGEAMLLVSNNYKDSKVKSTPGSARPAEVDVENKQAKLLLLLPTDRTKETQKHR
jgi:hypothetical protein